MTLTMKATPAWLVGLALLGCGHTQATEPPPADEHEAKPPAHHERRAAPAENPRETPVTESPAALLRPGAEDQIRDKLKAAGLLDAPSGPLDEAVRRFQKAHDLPVTGVVDHETARKLGLDPAKIFRRAEP